MEGQFGRHVTDVLQRTSLIRVVAWHSFRVCKVYSVDGLCVHLETLLTHKSLGVEAQSVCNFEVRTPPRRIDPTKLSKRSPCLNRLAKSLDAKHLTLTAEFVQTPSLKSVPGHLLLFSIH